MFILIIVYAILKFISAKEYRLCEDNQTEVVVNFTYSNNCTEKNQQIHCSTISAALSVLNLTNLCIIIEDNQTLSNVIVIKDVSNLSVIGVNSEIVINCASNLNAGILIYNVTRLLFMNLHITHCGSVSKQTFRRNAITLSSALFFSDLINVTFRNVQFTYSIGYSVILQNCRGKIDFETVNFQNNTIILPLNESLEHRSGGGLLILYSEDKINEIANINIENCVFQWNSGIINSTSKIKNLANEFDVPFGRGGGLSVFFTEVLGKNILSITKCKFWYNKGLWGGGLYIFQGLNSSITIKESSFFHNNGTFGGALRLSNKNIIEKIVTFQNCNFTYNSAQLGSAIYLFRVSLVLKQSQFSYNRWHFKQTIGLGAIYTHYSKIQFYGENFFDNNLNTAIILENAVAFVSGQIYFEGNKGNKGGALRLYINSKVIMSSNESSMFFIKNSALQGGAIYAEQSLSCSFNVVYKLDENENCFLSNKNSGKLEYSNNTASYVINDIFVSTLRCCHFKFWSYFGTNKFFTDPVNLYAYIDNLTSIYSGKLIYPTVFLVDELNQSLSSSIDVYLNGLLQRFVVKENKITMQVFGSKEQNYSIIFSLKNVYQTIIEFKLTFCPLGYAKEADSCICNSEKNLRKGIVCNTDGTISLLAGLYVNYTQKAIQNDNETTHICPYGYCTPCPNLTCSFNPDNQCVKGRLGYLCSKCQENKTVEFGGEDCIKKCSLLNLLFILPGILFIFALVCFAVAFLNICIYDSWLNSCIYFYQVIQYHVTATQNREDTFVNTFLQNIINFHGVHIGPHKISLCLINEWNDLDKVAFNYLIPLTMLVSVTVIAKWNKLHNALQTLNNKVIYLLKVKSNEEVNLKCENNIIRVYVLISVLAYADITRITLTILYPVEYDGVKNHVYIYGDLIFFSQRHLIYSIIAIFFVLFIVLLWPLLLITTVWWTKLKVFQYFGRLYPIFSAFNAPFHDRFQWFASLYFFSRVVIIAFGILIDDKLIQMVSVTISSLTLLFVFTLCFPYKNPASNYFDIFLQSLLLLSGVLSIGKYGLLVNKYTFFLFSVVRALMILPFILLLLRWFYCFSVWINLKDWFRDRILNKVRYFLLKN
ncbi:uncharacterized protein LOC105848891 [Hydra vulgaris]|uniref:uncharacterized protein LOC105848891 n=1 Tax=Hydra vulgaris TaxID=6087 RepID=UPI0006414EA8|nr:uncharacterized protein LOC105848891 [Hydra vulgaris]